MLFSLNEFIWEQIRDILLKQRLRCTTIVWLDLVVGLDCPLQHPLGLDIVSNKSEKSSGEKCGPHNFVASLRKVFVDVKDFVEFSPAKNLSKSFMLQGDSNSTLPPYSLCIECRVQQACTMFAE